MSNLIKASMIRYDESYRSIDQNVKAEGFVEMHLAKYGICNEQAAQEEILPDNAAFGDENADDPDYDPEEEKIRRQQQKILDNQIEIAALEEKLEALKQEAADILDRAETDAARIIDKAKADAEKQKTEIIDKYKLEGYNTGLEVAGNEVDRKKAELSRRIKENDEYYEKQVRQIEPAFVEILMKYLKKLTGVYVEEDREIIIHLVDSAITEQISGSHFLVRVSSDDYETILNSKGMLLSKLPASVDIDIVEDTVLAKGECMIETGTRIFDCGIDTQLKDLIRQLKMLSVDERE